MKTRVITVLAASLLLAGCAELYHYKLRRDSGYQKILSPDTDVRALSDAALRQCSTYEGPRDTQDTIHRPQECAIESKRRFEEKYDKMIRDENAARKRRIEEAEKLVGSPALSSVPFYDEKISCGHMPVGHPYYNICLREEQASYDALKYMWREVSDKTKAECMSYNSNEYQRLRYSALYNCIAERRQLQIMTSPYQFRR
jgi:hypothetical protein